MRSWFIVFVVFILSLRLARCQQLIGACTQMPGKTMTKICEGRYPQEISFRYYDTLVGTGEKYAIYEIDNRSEAYFISFKDGALLKCSRFSLEADRKKHHCVEPESEEFKLDPGSIRCMSYHLQMTDDLLQMCKSKKLEPKKNPNKSAFTVIHYSGRQINEKGRSMDHSSSAPLQLHPLLLFLSLFAAICIK